MQATVPPAISDFPALSGLAPEQRCQFALVEFTDHPGLPDYLVEQGMHPDQVPEWVALVQSWKNAPSKERRELAAPIIDGPPIVIDARAGLTENTRRYLQTLRPGQRVSASRIRAARVLKSNVVRLRAPGRRRSTNHGHAARAICGGSGNDDSGGSDEGPASSPVAPPPAPTLPVAPHTAERKRLLASHCSCCGRPLCDAASASIGVGPTCRKRLGITNDVGHRLSANEVMARLVEAGEDGDAQSVLRLVAELRALDPAYEKLADRIDARWLKTMAPFLVMKSTGRPDTHLCIKTPYSASFVEFCRDNGFWWLPKPIRAWQFPSDCLPDVLEQVEQTYDVLAVLTTDLKPAHTLTSKVVI